MSSPLTHEIYAAAAARSLGWPTLAACALANGVRFEFGDTPVQSRIFGTQSGC